MLILDVIFVLHHEVGKTTRNKREHKELLKDGIFYLQAMYIPQLGNELYDNLEMLPLPKLTITKNFNLVEGY